MWDKLLIKKLEYIAFNNLPKAQRNALLLLKNNKTQYYYQEMYRQLGNSSFYVKLRGDPTATFKIHETLQYFLQRGGISKT